MSENQQLQNNQGVPSTAIPNDNATYQLEHGYVFTCQITERNIIPLDNTPYMRLYVHLPAM
jgi:hypothetical protein